MERIYLLRYGVHRSLKNLVAHYLSPLHFCSRLICVAYKTKRHRVRCLIFNFIKTYDFIYQTVIK